MKSRKYSRILGTIIALAGSAFTLGVGHSTQAATYSAVNDFSLASNPSGTWGYGSSTDLLGNGFTAFTTAEALTGFSGSGQVWDNNGSFPNRDAIYKNTSGSTISGFTINLPTNELCLDPQSLIVDLRWTAPALGVYNVSGLFQRIDTTAAAVNIRIVENHTLGLLSQNNFATYGNTATFNLAALALPAGTVLDFLVTGASGASYDSTGLAATISTVPEPSSVVAVALGGAGLVGVGLRVRRARHA